MIIQTLFLKNIKNYGKKIINNKTIDVYIFRYSIFDNKQKIILPFMTLNDETEIVHSEWFPL